MTPVNAPKRGAAVVGAKFRSVRQAVSLLFAAVTVWLVGRILTTLL